jgi:hypothetical protein
MGSPLSFAIDAADPLTPISPKAINLRMREFIAIPPEVTVDSALRDRAGQYVLRAAGPAAWQNAFGPTPPCLGQLSTGKPMLMLEGDRR